MTATEIVKKQYTCAICNGTFNMGWSDDEAIAELKEEFPGVDIEDCSIVCDNCYKRMGFGNAQIP
jgi:hypothetical protein